MNLRGRVTEIGDLSVHVTLLSIDRSHIRLAQADCRFNQRIEHGLQVEA
jgi:hypothetical protein